MSASACALGHPLLESQLLCPECGLGRLPSAPEPLGTAAADAPTPAPEAAQPASAPEAAPYTPPPAAAPYAPPPAAMQLTPPSAATRYPPPSEAAQYTPAPEQLHYAAAATAPSTHWGQPALPAPPVGSPYGHPGFGGPGYAGPPVGYGAPSPQRSRVWIVVAGVAAAVVLIAGGAVWWTHRSVGSATGKVQADGSTVVNSRGVSITAPAGWTVVSTTASALAKAGESVAQSNPQLAAAMQGVAHNNDLRFFAYGATTPDGFTSNANVLVTKTPLPVSAAAAATAADLEKAGAKHVHDSGVTAGGTDAVELTYQLPLRLTNGSELTINATQVFESNGSEIGILTVGSTSTADGGTSALINSFRLT